MTGEAARCVILRQYFIRALYWRRSLRLFGRSAHAAKEESHLPRQVASKFEKIAVAAERPSPSGLCTRAPHVPDKSEDREAYLGPGASTPSAGINVKVQSMIRFKTTLDWAANQPRVLLRSQIPNTCHRVHVRSVQRHFSVIGCIRCRVTRAHVATEDEQGQFRTLVASLISTWWKMKRC